MELERITGLPIPVTVTPTESDLQTFVTEHEIYPTLTDQSTTGTIKDMKEVPETDEAGNSTRTLSYDAGILYEGTTYTKKYLEEQKQNPQVTSGETKAVTVTDEEMTVLKEVDSLQTALNNVLRATERLNLARQTKYGTLKDLKLMLNQTISFDRFSKEQTVKDAAN